MYHSQPVAWVLGETLDAAQRGAARVAVEYEPLPAILTIEDAIAGWKFSLRSAAAGARRRFGDRIKRRCVSKASWRSAARSTSIWKRNARIAWLDETGGVAAHSSTQHPTETQEVIARVLGNPAQSE